MEFGSDLKSSLVIIPRGLEFISPAPDNKVGLKWKNKYGYVAIDAFGQWEAALDGMNETGLAFSALWYEKNTQWQDIGTDERGTALAHGAIGTWILGNFSTVGEVKQALKKVKVFGLPIAELGGVPPLHFAVHDSSGGSIVMEWDQGEPHVYDNPLGIMTNAPNFPYHMTNLRNYIGMSTAMLSPQDYSGVKLNATGHGSGMFGLPGDITPPSRFIRMAVTTHFADQQDDAKGALNLAQHIVYSLDIVKGTVVDRAPDGKIVASESTQWASFRDLTNKIFYWRTYENFNLRKVELKRLNFAADKVKVTPLSGDEEVMFDVTDRLR
jgi:choloylglycine hydrolase